MLKDKGFGLRLLRSRLIEALQPLSLPTGPVCELTKAIQVSVDCSCRGACRNMVNPEIDPGRYDQEVVIWVQAPCRSENESYEHQLLESWSLGNK